MIGLGIGEAIVIGALIAVFGPIVAAVVIIGLLLLASKIEYRYRRWKWNR